MAKGTKKAATAPAEETEKKVAQKKGAELPEQYNGNVAQFLADCNATKRADWPAEWHELYQHYSK